eukprot:18769_2
MKEYFKSFLFVDYIIDLMYWIEILLNFYAPQSVDEVVSYDSKAVTRRYWKNGFRFDFISIIPLDILAVYFGIQSISYLRLPRMLRAIKLYRYVEKWEMEWKSAGGYFRIFLTFSMLIIVSHWIACLWLLE